MILVISMFQHDIYTYVKTAPTLSTELVRRFSSNYVRFGKALMLVKIY